MDNKSKPNVGPTPDNSKLLSVSQNNDLEPPKKPDDSHNHGQGEDHPCSCGEKDQNPDQQPVAKQEEEFIQELSYSALMKFVEANHPVHPITKKPFNIGDRVEVKDYYIKLVDPCNINKVIKKCIKCCKNYKKWSLKGGCCGKKDDSKDSKEADKK